ncbi:MAG: 2,3-diphosphoglycerate-dependent phosphoglycerate mutase [Gammaproteobacteria bacterium]|nr:2,3-diphosphoglycerate-dependent phosphoglycerate mutase [Gammaproteobacteria bacterium]
MAYLVLIRHGESTWNLENRFTGWVDVPLTPTGIKQAKNVGIFLATTGWHFDLVYTSVLQRAVITLWQCLEQMGCVWVPVIHSWRLNERHYGALQGLNKAEVARQYGDHQVLLWRRSYDVSPPELNTEDWRLLRQDRRYVELKDPEIPKSESLKYTINRVMPLWEDSILPQLKAGKNILIVAHGNSIRGLMKHLDQLSEEAIIELNIPNASPIFYELTPEAVFRRCQAIESNYQSALGN